MTNEAPGVNLRPMSVGEMLDRGFTVYVKNALVLTASLVVVVVPMMLLQYLGSRDLLGFDIAMMTDALKHPNAPQPPPDLNRLMTAYTNNLPWLSLSLLLSVFALPFANSAVIAGVSRSYLGERISLAECYRDAFRRWGHVLILIVLWIIAIVVAYIAFLIVILVLTFLLTALAVAAGSRFASTLAVTAVILALPFFIWLMVTIGQLYVTWALSFAAVVIEAADPVKAFGSGFSRVFAKGSYWRSFGVSAAILGIIAALESIGVGLGAALYFAFKLGSEAITPMYFGMLGLGAIVVTPVVFAIVAMYYYDARIRREGFDLEHLAQQLSGSGPSLPAAPA